LTEPDRHGIDPAAVEPPRLGDAADIGPIMGSSQRSPSRPDRASPRAAVTMFAAVPGVQPVPGTVVSVARVATAPSQQSGPGSNGSPTQSTVQVTIKATVPTGARDLEEAPVQVAITRETHQNVLLVPVAALLAGPGGYQVRLESDQYVPVKPGLFDSVNGTVEVTGALTAGQHVKVPAS
jgi:hypothetical protein